MLEDNDHTIKMALLNVQKIKRETQAKEYINPEIAETHR
jgi:stress-induced-phosphoprotein 1